MNHPVVVSTTWSCHPRLRDRSLPSSSTAWIDDALRQGAKQGRWPTAVPDLLGEPWNGDLFGSQPILGGWFWMILGHWCVWRMIFHDVLVIHVSWGCVFLDGEWFDDGFLMIWGDFWSNCQLKEGDCWCVLLLTCLLMIVFQMMLLK